ncbi:hypothetical protein HOE41_03680 [Candidatus Woesearchaeota archaeon]|nr:hypothetical protein [Candidatus Woesearchaeota archaeon]
MNKMIGIFEFKEPPYAKALGHEALKKRQDVLIKRTLPSDTLTIDRVGKDRHRFVVTGETVDDFNAFVAGYATKFFQTPINTRTDTGTGMELEGLVIPEETIVSIEETDLWYLLAKTRQARVGNKFKEVVNITNDRNISTHIVGYNLANDATTLMNWEFIGEPDFGRVDPVTVRVKLQGFNAEKVKELADELRDDLRTIHDACTMDDETFWTSRPYLSKKDLAATREAFRKTSAKVN